MDEKEADPEALANAAMQIDVINQTADYLGRGRQFEGLPLDDLREKWTLSVRKWKAVGYGAFRELDDLSAELRLRDEQEPWDQVQEVRKDMVSEVERSGLGDPDVRAKLQELLEAMRKPKN